ncbi:MAG: Prenyltransferase/squalene oxidase [Phycisphaerales bacterium]|nr:Prenyltransferase/squalene oxidase [Phycisphaerales bacterium]
MRRNLRFAICDLRLKSQCRALRARISNLHFALCILHFAIVFAFAFAFTFCLAPKPARADDLPPTLDASISHGLEYLSAQQNLDGSFGTTQKPAMTGLSLMSFLAAGHTPDVGKYGGVVSAAVDFLVSQSQPDGSFGHNEKPMYGQGIATLALAEAYGVESSRPQRKRIAAALSRAVALIVIAQDVKKQDPYNGGWRYEPTAPDSDLSLSGWNALALRACKDAGIAVPKPAVERAVQFVLKCYLPDPKAFSYQPAGAAQVGPTGVGVLCLHLLDDGNRKESKEAAQFLRAHPIDDQSQFPYYGMYYATQAAYQSDDAVWSAVSKATFDKLLKAQTQQDGGWPDTPEGAGGGRIYTTSLALLTLSIPYRLLPIYQR